MEGEGTVLTVTAVVPTHHRPTLLPRALRSIAIQAAVLREVIVVDDGDGSDAAAVHQAVNDSGIGRAVVIANSHAKGPSGARNCGAAAGRGDLLAFLDDDDEWLAGYLAAALERFGAQPIDVMCTDLLYRYDDGTERPGKRAPDCLAPESFLTRNPGLIGSNLIIRRPLYEEVGGFDESIPMMEDMDFGIRLGLRGTVRYEPLRERLVRHYQHTGRRLCTPRSAGARAGTRRFYELYAARMSAAQRLEFRDCVRRLWGIDEHGRVVDGPDVVAAQ